MSPDECKFTNGEGQWTQVPETKHPGRDVIVHCCAFHYLLSWCARILRGCVNESSCGSWTGSTGRVEVYIAGREYLQLCLNFSSSDVPVESLRLRFALLQSLNTTLETFFLPLVELRQTEMYSNSIAALLQEAKGQLLGERGCCLTGSYPSSSITVKTSDF